MTTRDKTRSAANFFFGLVLFISIGTSTLMFYEYFHVSGFVGNGDYPFGSEEAIAVGGDHYASKAAYLYRTRVDGFVFAGISLMIAAGVFSKHKWLAVLGGVCWLGHMLLMALGL